FRPTKLDHVRCGCTSLRVLDLARALVARGVIKEVEVCDIPVAQARGAREMALIGSSVKVAPIVAWDDMPIGDGKPGPITAALRALLEEDMRSGDRLTEVPYGGREDLMGQAIEALATFAPGPPWEGGPKGSEAVPKGIQAHAKLVLLDTLGVILAGSMQPEVAAARMRLVAVGGRGATAYAPGWPETDARTAAFLNGLAGRSIELCEGHRYFSC